MGRVAQSIEDVRRTPQDSHKDRQLKEQSSAKTDTGRQREPEALAKIDMAKERTIDQAGKGCRDKDQEKRHANEWGRS
jgi:hypothetical protein